MIVTFLEILSALTLDTNAAQAHIQLQSSVIEHLQSVHGKKHRKGIVLATVRCGKSKIVSPRRKVSNPVR